MNIEKIENVEKNQAAMKLWKEKKFPSIVAVQNKINCKLQMDPVWCLDVANICLVYQDKQLNWNKILFWICDCELKNLDGNTHLEGHIRMKYFPKETYKMHEKTVPCKIKEQGNRRVWISWKELCDHLDRMFYDLKEFVDGYRKIYNNL